jgi:hypothetical protein
MKLALLLLAFLTSASPVWADDAQINCDTVRAYVTQVGLVQAKAQARAAGMTAAQERRSRQCLSSKN